MREILYRFIRATRISVTNDTHPKSQPTHYNLPVYYGYNKYYSQEERDRYLKSLNKNPLGLIKAMQDNDLNAAKYLVEHGGHDYDATISKANPPTKYIPSIWAKERERTNFLDYFNEHRKLKEAVSTEGQKN